MQSWQDLQPQLDTAAWAMTQGAADDGYHNPVQASGGARRRGGGSSALADAQATCMPARPFWPTPCLCPIPPGLPVVVLERQLRRLYGHRGIGLDDGRLEQGGRGHVWRVRRAIPDRDAPHAPSTLLPASKLRHIHILQILYLERLGLRPWYKSPTPSAPLEPVPEPTPGASAGPPTPAPTPGTPGPSVAPPSPAPAPASCRPSSPARSRRR